MAASLSSLSPDLRRPAIVERNAGVPQPAGAWRQAAARSTSTRPPSIAITWAAALTAAAMRPTSRSSCVVPPDSFSS
jgi:hypothetical protein